MSQRMTDACLGQVRFSHVLTRRDMWVFNIRLGDRGIINAFSRKLPNGLFLSEERGS